MTRRRYGRVDVRDEDIVSVWQCDIDRSGSSFPICKKECHQIHLTHSPIIIIIIVETRWFAAAALTTPFPAKERRKYTMALSVPLRVCWRVNAMKNAQRHERRSSRSNERFY